MRLASAENYAGFVGSLLPALVALGLLLLALLLAGPAAAERIQRFTDQEGTIHIGNTGPAGAAAVGNPGNPAAPISLGRVPPPNQPLSGPPGVPVEPSLPSSSPPPVAGPTRQPHKPEPPQGEEVSPATGQQEVLQANDKAEGMVHAGPPLAPPAPAGPPPVRPRPGREDSSQPASSSAVSRYRDHAGVIHITNHPAPERAVQVAEAPRPAAASLTLASSQSAPSGDLAISPVVSRYQDQHGVIHITNAPLRGPPAVQVAAATGGPDIRSLARSRAGLALVEKVASSRQVSAGVAQAQTRGPGEGRLQTAPGESLPAPSPPREAVAPPAMVKLPEPAGQVRAASPGLEPLGSPGSLFVGGIRRYRDNQGVWHIANLPQPRFAGTLALAPAAPRPVGPGPPAVEKAAPSPADIRPPPALPLLLAAGPGPPAGPAPFSPTVMVRRDPRGRLIISNLQPVRPPTRDARANPDLEPIIIEAAQGYRLPIPLVRAIIKVESNFAPQAVSPKGAMGLMQLMPGTAAFLGVQDPFCPRENILGGCRYFRLLLDSFNDSLPLALAAYNAGHQRVVAAGFRIPAIRETQEFVTRVLEHYYLSARGNRAPWI
jgi:soluble lytic murein transglycosylase-like protein